MTDGTLKPGDGLLMKGFTDHPSPTIKLSYKGPPRKGHYHIAVWLGVYANGVPGPAGASVDERLNLLGWVYDPKRADKAAAKAKAERARS